jgi:tRNA (guanine37-N1)-methyltransferase
MHIDILTIFPQMFSGPFDQSIINRAKKSGLVDIAVHDLRQWATDKHKTVDDRPFGGGPGMVMMIEPIDKAIKYLTNHSPLLAKEGVGKSDSSSPVSGLSSPYIVLTSAKGTSFSQAKAVELSKRDHLILIAGHYEGVDHRVEKHLVDESLSIGNYVLTGGELPVMVMVDAIVRLLPGALGDPESLAEESHSLPGYLEYPQYTRPEVYKHWRVPEVLLSGHHAQIKKWRAENAQK